MIDDKKIEATASKLCDYGSVYNSEHRIDGFMKGAKWMQEEFLKDLWHSASEEPREFAEVLAEAKITESIKTYISFKRNDALFKNWDEKDHIEAILKKLIKRIDEGKDF